MVALPIIVLSMQAVCPECKNDIDTSAYDDDLTEGQVIECDKCGITLEVTGVEDGLVETEIVDEGK